jgi:hypothetical protein
MTARQIGTTPNRSWCSSMNAQINVVAVALPREENFCGLEDFDGLLKLAVPSMRTKPGTVQTSNFGQPG